MKNPEVPRIVGVALVHHPVLGRGGETVTSAITNLDVHDIARSARTYGIARFYVVHPVAAQRELVERIVAHWTTGSSASRIPTRKEALRLVHCVSSLEEASTELQALAESDVAPEWWTTSAARGETSYADGRALLARPGPPVLLMFGTSWGLTGATTSAAAVRLQPLTGAQAGFNHLSVRAACAIILDRLLAAGPT
jgi:hypothetical protein